MRTHFAILVSAALLAACGSTDADLVNPGGLASHAGASGGGGGGGGSKTLRCNYTDLCDQVTGTFTATEESDFQTTCMAGGGSSGTGGCNTSGAVAGYCSFTNDPLLYGASGDWREYYYPPTYDATSAASSCGTITGSTWVP